MLLFGVQVTLLQLKKKFGKGKQAKEFISRLQRVPWQHWLSSSNSLHHLQSRVFLSFHQGQKGIPHPQALQSFSSMVHVHLLYLCVPGQAPHVRDAMMFKVLEPVMETGTTGTSTSSNVTLLK